MNYTKAGLFLLLISTLLLFSCGSDPDLRRPAERKVRQSIKIHDDNVNGIDVRTLNNRVADITNFYYNSDGLLDSLNVMSDSTPSSRLIKSMKLTYFPNKIRGAIFDDSTGTFYVDFRFNTSKQLTAIIDTLGIGFGTFVTYTNNKISKIQTVLDSVSTLNNFVYDAQDNLIQYVTSDYRNRPLTRVTYEYDYSRLIPQYMDIRFASAGILYVYSGGVNVISLMGLNYGLGNTHRIFKRKEYNLQTSQNGFNYIFEYGVNNNEEIIDRKITVNDTIDVSYQYRY